MINFTGKNAITVIQLNISYNYNGGREGYARVLNTPKRKAATAKNKALGKEGNISKEKHQARQIQTTATTSIVQKNKRIECT